jgi:hypothetical protein
LKVPYDTLRKAEVPEFDARHAREPGQFSGEFFRVKGRVVSSRPVQVEAGGKTYEVFAHDSELLRRIQSWERDATVEFVGQKGLHRGRPQFVVFDGSWLE